MNNITNAAPMMLRDAERAKPRNPWRYAAPVCALAFVVGVIGLAGTGLGVW